MINDNKLLTFLPLPLDMLVKYPTLTEERATTAWLKYLAAVKNNYALAIYHETYKKVYGGEPELLMSLKKLKKDCGRIRINGKVEWAWYVFHKIHPFFTIEERGNSYTKKITSVIPKDKKGLKVLIQSSTPTQKYFPGLTNDEVEGLPAIPIDIISLNNYVISTKSNLKNPELVKAVPAMQRYIEQAESILRIIIDCNDTGIITDDTPIALPYQQYKSDFGRTYHQGANLQNAAKIVRNAALGDCYEYDLNSAVVGVKLMLFQMIVEHHVNKVNYKKLSTYSREYLQDKNNIRKQLTKVLKNAYYKGDKFSSMHFAEANIKSALTAVCFGAKIDDTAYYNKKNQEVEYTAIAKIIRTKEERDAVQNARGGFLRHFIKEQKLLTDVIIDYYKSNNLLDDIKGDTRFYDRSNRIKKPVVMAKIYQSIEADIMEYLEAAIIQEAEAEAVEGVEVKSPIILKVHDAFYSKAKISKAVLSSALLIYQRQYNKDLQLQYLTVSEKKHNRYAIPYLWDEHGYYHKIRIQEEERQAKGYVKNRATILASRGEY